MSGDLEAAAAAAGMRLMPLRKLREPMAQVVHALHHHQVDAVIDGGANRGQYAQALRAEGWQGPIVSIEPDPDVHHALTVTAAGDPGWRVLPPMALGDGDQEALLDRSAESDMSSLLRQSRTLQHLSPSSRVLSQVAVRMRRLDGLAALLDDSWRRMLIKLDLQGGEAAALDGADGLLGRTVGVQVEMPLIESYVGERPWLETVRWLAGRGFSLHLMIPGYFERSLARQLQVDGVFFRESADPPIA